jgi:hypothetical protein
MRRLVALLAALAAAVAPVGFAGSHPSLRVVAQSPLRIAGAGFAAGEALRVTATAGDRSWHKALAAGPRGGFVTTWQDARWDPCATPLVLFARGAKSGAVTVKLPLRECAAQ